MDHALGREEHAALLDEIRAVLRSTDPGLLRSGGELIDEQGDRLAAEAEFGGSWHTLTAWWWMNHWDLFPPAFGTMTTAERSRIAAAVVVYVWTMMDPDAHGSPMRTRLQEKQFAGDGKYEPWNRERDEPRLRSWLPRKLIREAIGILRSESDYRAVIDARRGDLEERLLASSSFRAAADSSARWESARAAAGAEYQRWQQKIEAFRADHPDPWEPDGTEAEDFRLLRDAAWEAHLCVFAEHGFKLSADDGAPRIGKPSEFHRTTDLRATSDELWQKLDTFRDRLLRGSAYTPGEWLSLVIDIRRLAHAARLRPNLPTVEWVIATVPELRARCPGAWDDEADDGWHLLFTAAGECGWSEMHNLLDSFRDRAKREYATEWAESWMNARERQLVGTARAEGGPEAATTAAASGEGSEPAGTADPDPVLSDPAARVLAFLGKQGVARPRVYIADNEPMDRDSVGAAASELIGHKLIDDRGRRTGLAINQRGREWLKRHSQTAN